MPEREHGGVDPVAAQRPRQRPHDRSLRPPELHRPPRTGCCEKEISDVGGSRSAAEPSWLERVGLLAPCASIGAPLARAYRGTRDPLDPARQCPANGVRCRRTFRRAPPFSTASTLGATNAFGGGSRPCAASCVARASTAKAFSSPTRSKAATVFSMAFLASPRFGATVQPNRPAKANMFRPR